MNSLTGLCRKWGVPPTTIVNSVWKFPELRQYLTIEKRGLRYFYRVKDEEGLKNFLKNLGYQIQEGSHV